MSAKLLQENNGDSNVAIGYGTKSGDDSPLRFEAQADLKYVQSMPDGFNVTISDPKAPKGRIRVPKDEYIPGWWTAV